MVAKKTKKVIPPPAAPLRDPDHVSKRGVNYWWSPEWVRCTNSSNTSYGRIKAIKEHGTVNLYMYSKEGKLSYIQGSIQAELDKCILLCMNCHAEEHERLGIN